MSVTVSYCQSRLAALGITPEMNRAVFRYGTKDKEEGFFQADPHDNIRILYLDPDGVQASYINERGANRPYYRLRLKTPVGDNKYKTPAKATALPFIPPQVLQKVKLGMVIETLFLTEGEFKAFAGCIHGMDCLGTSGIFHFKNGKKKELHPWILQIVEACRISNIVFLYDSDATNLYSEMTRCNPEMLVTRDTAKRVGNFCSSMKQFKECCKHTELDAFVSIINPQHQLKGLDDLFAGLPGETDCIAQDALLLSQSSGYFYTLSLHDFSNFKINAFFGLNTIDEFYEKHRDILSTHEFNFRESIYRFNTETAKVELSDTNFEPFWELDKDTCKLNLTRCFDVLHKSGFRLYRIDLNNYLIVRVEENIVDLVDSKQVKEFLIAYISRIKHLADDVKMIIQNALLAYNNLFSMQMLNILQCLPDEFHGDTLDKLFFYYRNGFVQVTKNGAELKPYSELNRFVWKSQILHRHYQEAPIEKLRDFAFNQFLWAITATKTEGVYVENDSRYDSFLTILGYAMHTAKREKRAILFTDMDINDTPEGRTGKSLISKALGFMRVLTLIDGKNYDPEYEFKWQKCTIETQIMCLNDVGGNRKKFDFEHLFAAVTEGAEIKQKNKPAFTINCTVLISSNRVISITSGSARARVIEFEFANFFSDKRSPKEIYGHWFFDDWQESDWHMFDSLMMECSATYLRNGLMRSESVNLDRRKVMEDTSRNDDFLEFAQKEIVPGVSFSKKQLFEQFKKVYDYDSLTSQKFTGWLKAYGTYLGCSLDFSHGIQGDRYFIFNSVAKK